MKDIKKIIHRILVETFNEKLKNIEKIDSFEYKISDENIEAIINFTNQNNIHDLPNVVTDIIKVNNYYVVNWRWKEIKGDKPFNWVRTTNTVFDVIDNFTKDVKPQIIKFNGTDKNLDKFYKSRNFQNKIRTSLPQFDLVEQPVVYDGVVAYTNFYLIRK